MQVVLRDIYFPPEKIEFEGRTCYAPHKIAKYLEIIYGPGYMQLPPEEYRKSYKPLKIKL